VTDFPVLATLGLERAHASPLGIGVLVAILLANAAHLLSALVLYQLTRTIFPGAAGHRVALLSAFLHILSPAGLFLSAPYAESLFASLSFLGQLLYAKSMLAHAEHHALRKDALVVASGFMFGLATSARSNGLFNGLFFLYDAAKTVMHLRSHPCFSTVRSLLACCVGGAFVGLGMLVPQIIAYANFCLEEQSRSRWCARWVPSIYLWVQQHYWFVGSPGPKLRRLCADPLRCP
jgi:phosphatidylinositol glycan class V